MTDSPLLDHFYIGQTGDLEKHIQEYNSAAFINSYTSKLMTGLCSFLLNVVQGILL